MNSLVNSLKTSDFKTLFEVFCMQLAVHTLGSFTCLPALRTCISCVKYLSQCCNVENWSKFHNFYGHAILTTVTVFCIDFFLSFIGETIPFHVIPSLVHGVFHFKTCIGLFSHGGLVWDFFMFLRHWICLGVFHIRNIY